MFKSREIKTYTLGEKIKDARKSMKMSLWQISKKTGISLDYLIFLEEGNYNKLPADIYIVAYLKKYAKFLNLDIDETLEQFKTEKGVTDDLIDSPKHNIKTHGFIKKPFLVVTPKRLSLVLAIIFISLIFGYFWRQASYLISPPMIKITKPAAELTTIQKSLEISGKTYPDVYLTVNGKEIHVDQDGYFSDIIDLEEGLNILNVQAKDRLGKVNAVVRRVMVIK